jgi:protein TonB
MFGAPVLALAALLPQAFAQNAAGKLGELTPEQLIQLTKESSPVTQATVIYRAPPRYTPQALAAKLEGTVILTVTVSAKGEPQNPRVTQGLGKGLDQEALAAVRQWRFRPATRAGKPISSTISVSLVFKIRK